MRRLTWRLAGIINVDRNSGNDGVGASDRGNGRGRASFGSLQRDAEASGREAGGGRRRS